MTTVLDARRATWLLRAAAAVGALSVLLRAACVLAHGRRIADFAATLIVSFDSDGSLQVLEITGGIPLLLLSSSLESSCHHKQQGTRGEDEPGATLRTNSAGAAKLFEVGVRSCVTAHTLELPPGACNSISQRCSAYL